MEAQSMTVSAVLNRLGKNQKTVDQFQVLSMGPKRLVLTLAIRN